jgi:hypothetical protein
MKNSTKKKYKLSVDLEYWKLSKARFGRIMKKDTRALKLQGIIFIFNYRLLEYSVNIALEQTHETIALWGNTYNYFT